MSSNVTFVIGEINGRADLLGAAMQQINTFAAAQGIEVPKVVTIGDYIDHGRQSKQVLDLLIDNPFRFDLICLKGDNEDRLMQIFAYDDPVAIGTAIRRWMTNGGMATLMSFSDSHPGRQIAAESEADIVAETIGARYIDFIASLLPYHDDEIFYFAHAGINPALSLEDQQDEDLLYAGRAFRQAQEPFERIIVHAGGAEGKSDEPTVSPHRINVSARANRHDRIPVSILEVGRAVRVIWAESRSFGLSLPSPQANTTTR